MTGDLRLGIDVGGTHTDAVLVRTDRSLMAATKTPTLADIAKGIDLAIAGVLSEAEVEPSRVSHVMIGTTHATNAVLERRDLRKVATVRVGSPSSDSIRPLSGWPADLRRVVSAGEVNIPGGIEFDGTEVVPFGREELLRFLDSLPRQVDGVAITSVFAAVSGEHELLARDIIRSELGSDVHISMSHEVGSHGLLERENATVLNEALIGASHSVTEALTRALDKNGLGGAVVYFAQNDGTLMTVEYALHFPVLTIGSGPANSLRGAAYLSGLDDALVVDVGGTSTDIGMLVNGFPRESTLGVSIGGITTNFRMPDLVSIAIGGGSRINGDPAAVRVGPESVGYRLPEDALIFGGDVPTLSDAAVHDGRANFGTHDLKGRGDLLTAGLALADRLIGEAVDRIRTSRDSRPLIVVGGGSSLVPDRLDGVSEVIRTEHAAVANAIGAAIGTVSGQADRIVRMDPGSRARQLEEAQDEARRQAIRAGADPTRIEIVSLEELPLAYLTEPRVRIRVKAAGPLEFSGGDPTEVPTEGLV